MTTHPEKTETEIDPVQLRRLIAAHAPHWAELPLRRVPSSGTDNALYRLGPDLLIRVPRRPSAVVLLQKELDWLPHLQGLPLATPKLRQRGNSETGLEFGILDWIEGEIATPKRLADPVDAAHQLADFLKALQQKDTTGAPRAGAQNSRRGVALPVLDDVTHAAIETLSDELDASRAHRLWEAACAVPIHTPPVWLHGDLKADNLIARDGRLHAVIDWGLAAVGDPAADYAATWSWIAPEARTAFRDRLALDDAQWLRARGWALYGAVIALSFYRGGANEALCQQSRHTLSQLALLL